MKHGWTGGQYSLFRALFGAYLAVHFAMLIPYAREVWSNEGVLPDAHASPLIAYFPSLFRFVDSPIAVCITLATAAIASVFFGAGWKDRWLAIFLWYVLASMFARNPLISNPSLPYVGWMLVAHACLPRAPFGSLDARGRIDPDGGWKLPNGVFLAAWVALAVGYTYSGCAKLGSPSWVDGTALERVLENPLVRPGLARDALRAMPKPLLHLATWGALAFEIGFAPLALFTVTRRWAWLAMLAMHCSLILLIDFADLSIGMVLMHLFTFDPRWIAPRPAATIERVFYDGGCGLCHRWVRFVMAEDREGDRIRFAPLASEAFEQSVPRERRAGLPDSIVVATAGGRLLVRSEAVLHILERMGGAWRAIAIGTSAIPRPIRDFAYDAVARVRKRIFAPPPDACPLGPAHLHARFDA